MASADQSRRAHAFLRRLSVVAICRLPLVFSTGDYDILNETVPFIEGRPLKPEEEAYFDLPRVGPSSTLYEHCVRAVNNGLKFGVHGIPLMGCGDWNDGMNLVGEHGKGESVWLALFPAQRADPIFASCAPASRRHVRAEMRRRSRNACTTTSSKTHGTVIGINAHGSTTAHHWAQEKTRNARSTPSRKVGPSFPAPAILRAPAQAMDAVDQRLVRRDGRLIQLFTPAFDKSSLNPGYIKGYVPGIRENGGQYTHAAVWTIIAFTMMGDHIAPGNCSA